MSEKTVPKSETIAERSYLAKGALAYGAGELKVEEIGRGIVVDRSGAAVSHDL
jgi:hypothetical protein